MRTQVKVYINESSDTPISASSNCPQLQISNLEGIVNAIPSGYRGFHLSENYNTVSSRLSSSDGLFSDKGYPGFVSQEISDIDGYFENSPYIDIVIPVVKTNFLQISFDNITREYAKRILLSVSVDNATGIEFDKWQSIYTINLESAGISLGDSNVSLRLLFIQWSDPYRNVKVTSITDGRVITFDGTNIIDMECSGHKLTSQLTVAPGINEQYADFKLYDRTNIIHFCAQQGLLTSGQKVIVNIIDDRENIFDSFEYFTKEWDVRATQSAFTLSCTDNSQTFKNYFIGQHDRAYRTLDEMLTLAFARANGAPWKYSSPETKRICTNIYNTKQWFSSIDVFDTLQHICTAGMLRIYWHRNTYIVTSFFEDCEGLFDD